MKMYSTVEASKFTKMHHHPHILCYTPHLFLGTPSLVRKSSSMRGRPSRNLTFGSHPSRSLAFVMSGFLWRGSSGVFSTIIISTLGLMSCKSHDQEISYPFTLHGDVEVVRRIAINRHALLKKTKKTRVNTKTYLLHILGKLDHCKFTWK